MSNVPSPEDKAKAWTPEQLEKHITDICGKVVASALEPLQKRITDNGNEWITAQEKMTKAAEAIALRTTEKGLVFGGILGCLAVARGDKKAAFEVAKETKQLDSVIKALEVSTGAGGGFLVAPEHSQDFIDLLTPRTAVRALGAQTLPMDSGVMDMPKLSASATAYYIGENQNIPKSQQAFGQVVFSAKKLAALVPISNSLLRRGGPQVNSIVRNDTLRSVSLKEDLTFLRSQGGQFSPRGMRYLAKASQVLTANGTVNLANVTYDLGRLVLALEEQNVAFTKPGWILSPRTAMYLMTVRDGNGNYAFRAEMMAGNLWGFPFKKTTQVPSNLGAGGDESEIYLADFDDLAIAQTTALSVAVSEEASYIDENNQLVSAFSLDQTVMRVIEEHDFNTRYAEAISILTGVTWAPTGA